MGKREVYMKVLQVVYKESIATIKLRKVNEKIPIKEKVKQGNIFQDCSRQYRRKYFLKELVKGRVRNQNKWRIPKRISHLPTILL